MKYNKLFVRLYFISPLPRAREINKRTLGAHSVPVVQIFDGKVMQMTFSEFVDCCNQPCSENLYLKDWHFQKEYVSQAFVHCQSFQM